MHDSRIARGSIIGLLLLGLLATPMAAVAQSGGPYDVSRSHLGSGGQSSGGPYDMFSTVGQAEGGSSMSGGDYTLVGGFLAAATSSRGKDRIYLPLLLRGAS